MVVNDQVFIAEVGRSLIPPFPVMPKHISRKCQVMYGSLLAQCCVSRENIKSHPFNQPGFDLDEHFFFFKSGFQHPPNNRG